MNTPQFLEYLHEHGETRTLAEDLATVIVLRGRPDLVPKPEMFADARRIAS